MSEDSLLPTGEQWIEVGTRWKSEFVGVLVLLAILGVLAPMFFQPVRDFDTSPRYHPAPFIDGEPFKDIAGDYFHGNGRGWNWYLSILPDGRYSLVWGTCTGVGHRESGQVQIADRRYVLTSVPTTPRQSSPESSRLRIDREFIAVRWTPQLYLIPPDKMETFCADVIEGREPTASDQGSFYRRRSRTTRQSELPHGLPELPEEWTKVLHDRTLLGRILDVNKDRVTINLGLVEGVRKESVIHIQAGDPQGRRLGVITVDDHQCKAFDPYSSSSQPIEIGQGVIVEKPAPVGSAALPLRTNRR